MEIRVGNKTLVSSADNIRSSTRIRLSAVEWASMASNLTEDHMRYSSVMLEASR